MKQLIWLTLNLHRDISNFDRDEECFIDTLDNEVFKTIYYNTQHQLIDIYYDTRKYTLDTYNTFKLISKRHRAEEDSIMRLRYIREDEKDNLSVLYNCFGFNLYSMPNNLKVLTRNELYNELVYRYDQNEQIRHQLKSKSEILMANLILSNTILSSVDLLNIKVWDFQLEQFPIRHEPIKKTKSNKVSSYGNIIAFAVAFILLYLIIKFGVRLK